MVNYVKSSQLPHTASVNTASGGDRFLTLTNPSLANAALQSVDMSVLIAGISTYWVNTGSPIIANSMTVNSSFVANSSGVFTSKLTTNNTISTNSNIFVGNSTVNTNIGWNSGDTSLAEFAGNVNNYIQVLAWNANASTNASADFILYDNIGPSGNNYVDIGINSTTWSNSSWTINGPSDGYVYTGNTNLAFGTGSANYLNFFTGGTLANNERMRISPTGNVGINNTNPIHTLSVNGNTYIGNTLIVNGNLTVTGNVTLSGTTTYVNSTVITTNDLNIILANNATTNTLANNAGLIIGTSANLIYNSTVTSWQSNVSFIPSTNNLNLGSTTQLWNVYGNNGFYTGTVNSTSYTVGTNFVANTTGVFVGSAGSNTVANTSGVYTTGLVNAASMNTSTISVGGEEVINATGVYTLGTVNSTSYTVGTNFVANTSGVYTLGTVNAASHTVGTAVVANATGVYTTGTVNAASMNTTTISVGGEEVINATGVYTLGTVNAASHTVGTAVVANATGVYTTGTVNTATFTATTSANVGANIQITTSAITVGNSSLATSVSVSVSNNTSNVQITPANITVANSTVSSVLGNGTISVVNATVTSNTLTLGTSNASGHTTYGSAGYTYLPNGLKMMWGAITTANSTANIVSFAAQTGFAFTTNCFSLTVTSNAVASVPAAFTVNATNFTLITNSVTASTVSFMAIGI